MIIGKADLLAEFYRENGLFEKYVISSPEWNQTKQHYFLFCGFECLCCDITFTQMLLLILCAKGWLWSSLSIVIAFASMNVLKEQTHMRHRSFDFFSNGHELFSAFCIVCLCLLMALKIQHLCFQIQEGHKSLYHVIICKWNNIHIIGLLRIAWDKEVHSTNANFLAAEELCLSPSTHISFSGNWELLEISQKSNVSSF